MSICVDAYHLAWFTRAKHLPSCAKSNATNALSVQFVPEMHGNAFDFAGVKIKCKTNDLSVQFAPGIRCNVFDFGGVPGQAQRPLDAPSPRHDRDTRGGMHEARANVGYAGTRKARDDTKALIRSHFKRIQVFVLVRVCTLAKEVEEVCKRKQEVLAAQVKSAISLRPFYAVPGTGIAYRAIWLRPSFAVSGTKIAYGAARSERSQRPFRAWKTGLCR
eukprot:1477894-Rhodomonas_salina.3